MPTYLKKIFTSLLFIISLSCYSQLLVTPDNKNIAYMGRVKVGSQSSSLYWPGSSATLNFKGTGVKATLQTFKAKALFYVIVDNDESKAIKINSDSVKKNHVLVSNLPYGKHTVKLYKLTDNTTENLFYGFEIEGKAKVLKPSKLPHRKIEFYGNSITAGHGVDVPEGMNDSGLPMYFNNYYTYASLTARHYKAQYSCIARSGIGIMVSWFPQIMPEAYDLLDPMDSKSKWDFNKYTPDIVVVNLFQNDYWLSNMPNHEQFKARFGTTKPTEEFIIQSYQNFISCIRGKYPKANIICALGSMNATEKGSKWPGYIEQAIKRLNDSKIHSVFFPFTNTFGHPKRQAQQVMANQLISFIDSTIKW